MTGEWGVGTVGRDGHRILDFFGSKMDKRDDNTLTNQPETVTIPSATLSRVVGCWDAGELGQMRLNLLRDHTCTYT
eukprot:scaffold73605_cov23-Cyclotella_meneghiniana.AAC.1